MNRTLLNLGLAIGLIVSIWLNVRLRQPATQPNWEFMPEMARSARVNAFEPNPSFADGATVRGPVPGTIPRGLPPLNFAPNRGGALRAGQELVNPFSPDDRAALERGAQLYADFCQVCHGPGGEGDGQIVEHGFRRPPSLLRPFTVRQRDGHYFHVLTFGQGRMASYAAQLSREDRWKVILHVRVLQEQGQQP